MQKNDLWWDRTWNPITGCSPISEGCEHCWAKRMANRLRGRYGYPQDEPFRVTFHPDRLNDPLRWKKPCRIFVCSMGDLFHEHVPIDWRYKVYRIIEKCPQHTFIFLTKRPKNILSRLWIQSQPNIWLIVSVENQARADERIPILLQIPAAVRGISLEPMLGPVDLLQMHQAAWKGKSGRPVIGWVILGGETGPGARPLHPDWVRKIRDDCQAADVPFFMKQMSKKESIPEDLLIREFPHGE